MGARVPEEGQIASVVDFLVSDAASFITCATIDVEQRLIVILAPRTAMAAVTINAWNRSMVAFRITAAARNT